MTPSFWERLPQPIIGLAPMDGVTDAPFRLMVAREGTPDVTFTEFTSAGDICRGPEFLLESLRYHEEERPVVAQLYGKDPALFYQAAHVVCELGFDGLDINMGCPSRSVASSGSGAGLIRTPALAHSLMQAARRGIADWAAGQTLQEAGLKPSRIEQVRLMNRTRGAADPPLRRCIPLSVKTRLGYDTVVIEDWVRHLLAEEPAVISVHGRTLEQMYRGEADWTAIERAARLVRETETLILGNGDLQSMEGVVRRVRETGVHGVLVGRGALGSPWFFRKKEMARTACRLGAGMDGLEADEMELAGRFHVMLEHARRFEMVAGRDRFPRMRKHLGWYCKGFPHAAAMRAAMVRACGSEDVERIVAEYFLKAMTAPPDPVRSDAVSCA